MSSNRGADFGLSLISTLLRCCSPSRALPCPATSGGRTRSSGGESSQAGPIPVRLRVERTERNRGLPEPLRSHHPNDDDVWRASFTGLGSRGSGVHRVEVIAMVRSARHPSRILVIENVVEIGMSPADVFAWCSPSVVAVQVNRAPRVGPR